MFSALWPMWMVAPSFSSRSVLALAFWSEPCTA